MSEGSIQAFVARGFARVSGTPERGYFRGGGVRFEVLHGRDHDDAKTGRHPRGILEIVGEGLILTPIHVSARWGATRIDPWVLTQRGSMHRRYALDASEMALLATLEALSGETWLYLHGRETSGEVGAPLRDGWRLTWSWDRHYLVMTERNGFAAIELGLRQVGGAS